MQKILLLDNYDSFTYNLRQLLAETRAKHSLTIVHNDQIKPEMVRAFDKILLSPGAGLPHEAGKMFEIIAEWSARKPFLGVCLGHQALAEHFGGKLFALPAPRHGIRQKLEIHHFTGLFAGISPKTKVGLYHSWAVERASLPACLDIMAEAEGVIMAIQHKTLPVCGVQFHPESIMTREGAKMMQNWLKM